MHVSERRCRLVVALAIAVAVAGVVAWSSSAISSPTARASAFERPYFGGSTTTLSSCNFTQLAVDVALGGTVRFGVDCAPFVVSHALTIPGKLEVNVSGDGYDPILSGGSETRLFIVEGGA